MGTLTSRGRRGRPSLGRDPPLAADVQEELEFESPARGKAALDRPPRVVRGGEDVVPTRHVAGVQELPPPATGADEGLEFREGGLRVRKPATDPGDLDPR